jgi:hypothetical protein
MRLLACAKTRIASRSALVLTVAIALSACTATQPASPVTQTSQAIEPNQDIDDYEAKDPSIIRAGEKTHRQLETEKIHRLAKLCIAANNVSKPCLEIVDINSRMGRFYILQEGAGLSSTVKMPNR